eukprot:CAMPEP_0205937610 /NCGR_PEP_ID=MMETSP1325-20131115/44625_1 /ASSEMBLY_ACC=CAM_ASM_000708 /TAXON_ID=236786 /ORGANISM="Florenciella sp., Strain RCC1007" /LENGTH=42 /DNA_ID= /DNA_START= /DNA_END= /DNA_ORIENTATION=
MSPFRNDLVAHPPPLATSSLTSDIFNANTGGLPRTPGGPLHP